MRTAAPLAIVAALAGPARADGGDVTVAPAALAIPTAWTAPTTTATAAFEVDHRGGAGARALVRYTRLVDLDLRLDGDVSRCAPCSGVARVVEPVRRLTAGWKLGLRTWRGGAVAGGVRVPLTDEAPRAAEAYGVVSQRLGPVRLHGGASAWASTHRGDDGLTIHRAATSSVRPLVGLEWTPTIYPRTTLLADLQWLPQLGPTAAETGPRWSLAWGVRYQALSWGAIALGVHHRQGDQLGDATVSVGWAATWSTAPTSARRASPHR